MLFLGLNLYLNLLNINIYTVEVFIQELGLI